MKKNRYLGRALLTLLAAFFALAFLLPTVLTITNSFMTQSEIAPTTARCSPPPPGTGRRISPRR